MTTKLTGVLRREIEIDGALFTLLLDAKGLRLMPKGRRKGFLLEWHSLVSGEAALATALQASLTTLPSVMKPVATAAKKTGRNKPVAARKKARRR